MFVNFKICINANIVLMGVRFLRLHELDIKITDRKADIHLEIHPLTDPDTRIYFIYLQRVQPGLMRVEW